MKIKGLWLRGDAYWYRIMSNGERRVWNLHTRDLDTAISRAAEKKRAVGAEPADLVKRELDKAIASKLAQCAIRPKTETGMRSVVKIFSEWCGPVSVESICEDKAKEFIAHLREKGMKEPGVQSYVRSLRSAFAWLKKNRRVMSNPFSVKLPKLPKSPRRDFCSVEERDDLIENAPDEDLRLILLLGFHAGLRKLEIVEARAEWIDLGQKVIHISKTETYTPKDSEDRTVPLSKALLAHFTRCGIASPFLIKPAAKHGKSEYRYDYRAPFNAYMASKGMPHVTSHTMRRTFASLLIQRGVSIYKAAKWLGDAVAVVENSYGHLKSYDAEID